MNPAKRGTDRWGLVLLIAGLSGGTLGLTAAVGSVAATVSNVLQGRAEAASASAWAAVTMGVIGLCGVPAVLHGGRALFGQAAVGPSRPRAAWLAAAALFPVAVGLGYLALERGTLPHWVAPPAELGAVAVPVLVAAMMVRLAGPPLSSRRAWGQFLTGLWGMPPLALVMEALALIPVVLIVGIGLAGSPAGQRLLQRVMEEGANPSLAVDREMLSLLFKPWMAAPILGYVAVLVPLIEEAVKTMAVWPLLRRRLSAAEAFLGGALGGAGYALFEALFLTQPGASWASAAVGRSGASMMHTFTAALSSWGLAQGFVERRWGRLVLAFGASVAMHGLWNASAIGAGVVLAGTEAGGGTIPLALAHFIGVAGPAVLVTLSLLAFMGLPIVMRRLASPIGADRRGAPA